MDSCPNCGYCRHCGRGGYNTQPYPYYRPWPTYPWGQTWTVTSQPGINDLVDRTNISGMQSTTDWVTTGRQQ